MASLETRLEKLEHAKRSVSSRVLTDAERAVRLMWMLDTKAPGWERFVERLRADTAKNARVDKQ